MQQLASTSTASDRLMVFGVLSVRTSLASLVQSAEKDKEQPQSYWSDRQCLAALVYYARPQAAVQYAA